MENKMRFKKAVVYIFGVAIISVMFLKPVYADEVDDLISKLNNASDMEKPTIVFQLAETRDPRIVQALIEFGKEADFMQRLVYIAPFNLLGNIAVKQLAQAMKSDDVKIRRFATKAIGLAASTMGVFSRENITSDEIRGVADSRAIQPLLEALKDKDKIVRINAACSLGMLGREDGLDVAISGLKDDNWKVVVEAIDALGWIANKKGLEALETLYNNTTPPTEEALHEAYSMYPADFAALTPEYKNIIVFQMLQENINRAKYYSSEEHLKLEREMLQKHREFVDE